MFKFIDAFCGAGGLGLGLKKAGLQPILSFDNDPRCIETMNLNKELFSHKVVVADINNFLKGKWKKHLNKSDAGNVFLVAGGPPCQGFSVQRIGKDKDSRNNLVKSYLDFVLEVSPKYFVLENVVGIKGKRGKDVLNYLCSNAEANGYSVSFETLDAQNFGVPQRRKRVVVVGRKRTLDGTFCFPEHVSEKITVWDTIGGLPDVDIVDKNSKFGKHHLADKLSDLNKKRLKALLPGQAMEDLPKHLLADCHKAGADKIGHRNVYGRMAWDEVAPTITARFDSFTRGKFGHPENLRSISLREGALLQTFPPEFSFSGNKVDIARQIGNAVPPKLGEAIGHAILRHYFDQKTKSDTKGKKQQMEMRLGQF